MKKNKNILTESILKTEIPDSISQKVESFKTYLGGNAAIPNVYDEPFLSVVMKKSFENALSTLKEIGSIEDINSNNLEDALSELIERCVKLERPVRDELEKTCYNYVLDIFDIPSDKITIETILTDKVEINDTVIQIEPNQNDFNFDFKDVESMDEFKLLVGKRKILNTLCDGLGMTISDDIASYEDDIKHLNPDLCDLYRKILAINSYLLYTNENVEITDKNKRQIGCVTISIGDDDELIKIKSQGVIFPILLSETVKGLAELFALHGLPNDKKTALAIMSKTDYVKGEIWKMRFGMELWNRFSQSFNDITYGELPYLFKRIATLDTDDFNYLMKEVFAKTKKGKQLMSIISKKAKKDKDYNSFLNKMTRMKDNNGIIIDEYINPDEL